MRTHAYTRYTRAVWLWFNVVQCVSVGELKLYSITGLAC